MSQCRVRYMPTSDVDIAHVTDSSDNGSDNDNDNNKASDNYDPECDFVSMPLVDRARRMLRMLSSETFEWTGPHPPTRATYPRWMSWMSAMNDECNNNSAPL